MKQFTSGMKRGFAMLMALVMVLTAMQSGLISLVHAEESYDETAHLNNIVVENYGGKLTQQMEIILSGLLEGDKTFQYNYPETGLIEVDSKTKTITASVSQEGWVPVRANILVDDKSVETVVLTNGVGTYEYNGNAFSVVVTYHLYTEQFTQEEQLKLMNAAYYLMLDYKNIHGLRTGTVESVLKLLTDKQAALENIDGIELEDTTAIGLIYLLATEGIELPALELGGEPWVLEFHRTSPSKQAAKDLFFDKEDDGVLALYKELNNKLSDLELLDKNSATLLEALVSNYEDIQTLATDDRGLQLVIDDLAAYIAEAETALPEMKDQLAEYKELLKTLKDTEAQLAEARTQLNEMKTLWAEYKTAKAQLEEARALLNQAKDLVSAYETNKAKLDAELLEKFGTSDYAKAKEIIAQFGHLDPENSQAALKAIEYIENYADEYETAKAQIAENEPKLIEAEKQMAEAEKEIEKKLAEYGVTLATADEYLAKAETELAAAEKQLADAKAEADKELKKLGMSLATIDADLAAAEAKLAEAEAGLAQMDIVKTAINYLISEMKSFCTAAAPAYNCTEWHTLTKDLIKNGLNSDQYTKLTNMVAPLDIKAPFTDADVSTKLQINTYEVKYNMSMFNVDVYVKVYDLDGVMGSNNLGEPKIEHVQVTLVQGATKDQIEAAILAAGLNPGACPENHVPHTSTVLPDVLVEDVVHTVTYIPAEYTYTITDGGNEIAKQNVYHGYTMRLPAYTASNDKVYEYIINGVTYAQNSVITITGNTSIERVLGKPRTVIYLKHLVSDTMGGGLTVNGQYGLSADAAAILSSAALNTPTIAIRIPGTDVQPVISAGKVTAPKYSSDFEGLYWEPAIAYFVDENGQTIAKKEMINGSCDLIGSDYAQVKVSYKLVVSEGFSQTQLLNMLNLPNTLVQEYKAQTAELKVLNDQYSALAQLNSQNMGMIMTAAKLIDDEAAKASITAILNEINENSMDTASGQLKLYNLLTGYNTEGIAYYYANYDAFTKEVNALTGYLTRLWADPVNKAALIKVMEDNAAMLGKTPAEMLEYIAPLDALLNAMNGLTLTAPNAAINTKSEQLGALGAAIENAVKVPTFSGSVAHPVIYTVPSVSPSVVAPDKVSFNFTIYINGAKVVLSAPTSMTFRLDKATSTYTLTDNDAKAIANMVTNAVREAQAIAPLDAMYKCEAEGALPKAGDVLTSSVDLTYEYTAKTFTVYVEGTAEQTISHTTTMKVTLPAGNAYVRYEYIIGGKTVPAGTYTFTEDEIVLLFPYGTLNVERIETELDPVGDKLQSVVDTMNGGDVKVEMNSSKNDDGTYNYVLDMYIPTTVMSNPSVLTNIGMGLIGGYQYIEINDEVLLDGKMYVQALVNAVMDSGLGSKTIQQIAAKNGGKLMSAKLGLGATDVDVVATLNVHLVGDSDELDQIASLLERFGSYVNIVCVDGILQINLTLPEKAYQAYLAAMLMLDKRDLKNINDINGEVALGYILSVMDPVMTDENLTLDTFNNTLKKLGYNLDTEGLDKYFDRMVDAYNSLIWEYDEDGVATSITGRNSVINLIKSKLGAMGEMIADESISVSVALNVTNLAAEDYEAVYADISAAGITNKVGMTRDLAVKNFAGKAAIVLLSDIGSAEAPVSLTFADTTVLDLNGYTIYGDVKCTNGTLYIVDNSLDSVGTGGVTGKVSGNVVITSGTYNQDVSSMLKGGYSQVNGAVKNDYYTITETNGNYTITLNAAAVKPSNLPNFKTLALDILVDVALNGYNRGAMWINGHQVYDVALGNVVDAYSSSSKVDYLLDTIVNGTANQAPWVDVSELAELYNLFVKDLTNFENLANGEYLAQYELTTAPWDISVFVDGDHISAGVGSLSNATKKHTITIVLSDDATADSLKDLAGELDQIVDIYSDLEMSQNKVGNNIYINANYKESNLIIDLTTNAAKNRDYLIMIGTMLANVVDNNKALNEGLEILKTTGSANALKDAIDKCTVSDVLTALADVDRNYDFSEFGELGETYANVLKVVGAVIRKLDIADRGSRTLGSMNGSVYGTYVLDKENLSLSKTFTARGYNLIVSAKAPLVSVTLKLCNECQHAAAQKIPYKAPTCTEDGNIEHYYCAECDSYFLDAQCTQAVLKKEVIIPATGHSYDSVVTPPTCTEQGYTTHTCPCGDSYIDSYVEALGHNYKLTWTWAEDYSSAKATFTCQNDNTHVHVLDATVVLTDDSYEATCDQAGHLTYIATVNFEGKDYTDTKVLTPAATGHSYVSVVTPPTCTEQGYTTHTCHCGHSYIDSYVDPTGHSYQVEWNWADDYSSATATFTCGNGCGMIHDVLDAYVANNGKGVYIATVTYLGTVYVDIQAMEHTFTLARWEWADDYTYAVAVFTCNICGDEHTLTVAVPATCISRTEATCVDNGLAVYVATLNFAGDIYTDEAQQILLATGKHNAVFVPEKEADCSNNGNIAHWYCAACGKYFADEACTVELDSVVITGGHKYVTEKVDATCTEQGYTKHTCSVCGGYYVTDLLPAIGHNHQAVVTPPTCTTAGYTTYTCVNGCGDTYIDPTSIVPATGHNYEQVGGFNWAEDCSSATVTIKCPACGDEHTLDAAVKVTEHVEPSVAGDGKTVYTATAVYNGQIFTETKTVNHKYRLEIISVDMGTNAEVVGSKVTEDGYIYLDVQPAGVNVDTLMNLLTVKYDADKLTLTLTNSKEGSGLICNGSELTITASNNDGASISKTYVIIVLGDANCNGRIEVADIALIAATRAGTSTVELSKAAVLASDLNGNGGLDVGDVAKNANKVAYWDSYKSQL